MQATSFTGEVVYEEIDVSAITEFTVSTNVAYSILHTNQNKADIKLKSCNKLKQWVEYLTEWLVETIL